MDNHLSIGALASSYEAWARTNYTKHGHPTRTPANIHSALAELVAMFGSEPADQFGPAKLHELQQAMASSTKVDGTPRLKRRTINDRIRWVRAMFDWAATLEYVPELLPMRLSRVKNLRGEPRRPKPVVWERVCETLLHAPLKLRTMIELQWHTGMRPGEVCLMSRSSIISQGGVWTYRPAEHKSEHWGHERVIMLGPMAQSVLRTWLPRCRPGSDWLFEGGRFGRGSGRPMREQSYYQAIRRINEAQGIPPWTPHQLRHAAATRIRAEAGLEAAQVLLGHASATTTEIYAEPVRAQALDAAARLG